MSTGAITATLHYWYSTTVKHNASISQWYSVSPNSINIRSAVQIHIHYIVHTCTCV